VNIPTAPFCEQCGAANEPQATICSVCTHPLHTPRTTNDATEHESLLAETLLKGRYRIIKAVGQGGMGKVYRAQDLELNERAVAIKEMIVSGLRAWEVIEATEAFKREATLLAALQHPNLPTVFEHFEENGRWYMVMSFIPGETLEEYLKRTNRTRLPLNEVLDIGQQLCTALSYLHSQQPPLIFRDVKPANIMRAPDGHIYLIDFGVARRFKPGQKRDKTRCPGKHHRRCCERRHLYSVRQREENYAFTDDAFYAGTVGMLAEDNNSSTVINYQNAVIWTLPS